MDYHGWMLLEKSLGNLEYGAAFNRAVVDPDRGSGLMKWVATLRERIFSRPDVKKNSREMQNLPCCENRAHVRA